MHLTTFLIEAHIFRQIDENQIEFLLLKRSDGEIYSGVWQMVTGSIDKNEKAYQTALREIKEETSLLPKQFWVVPNVNSFYEPKKDYICMVPVFAALVDLDCQVTISNEHSEYKWVSLDEAKKLLAWRGQRNSVEIIYEYFTKEKSFLNFVEIKL
ncbi:MAG: NUDIX pyrophosphatase [Melioribacteraceae bacterium]|nr:NUDIX pyrophosphatase [Melioribacteraceae bacterium]WKZ71214.1 MAG: NUDIX pyrophosphatase [Melioribacteraceae bacterium]